MIRKFLADETGATAIEYGLITAIVALGIIAGLSQVRDALNALFALISAAFYS